MRSMTFQLYRSKRKKIYYEPMCPLSRALCTWKNKIRLSQNDILFLEQNSALKETFNIIKKQKRLTYKDTPKSRLKETKKKNIFLVLPDKKFVEKIKITLTRARVEEWIKFARIKLLAKAYKLTPGQDAFIDQVINKHTGQSSLVDYWLFSGVPLHIDEYRQISTDPADHSVALTD